MFLSVKPNQCVKSSEQRGAYADITFQQGSMESHALLKLAYQIAQSDLSFCRCLIERALMSVRVSA